MQAVRDAVQYAREHPLGVAGCVASGLTRLIPHPPNMTSMTAFGIYSGAKLSPLAGCILGFVVMVVTDALLGAMQMSASWNTQHVYLGFGAWTAFTYLGLALDLGIGQRLARNTEHAGWLSLAAVLGSLQFFVVSNFGVWATGSESVYAHNMAGLMACYAAALPFLGWQVLGDLGYTAIFFGAHALASKNVAALRSESVEMQLASEGAGEHVPLADADEEMANKTAAEEVVIA